MLKLISLAFASVITLCTAKQPITVKQLPDGVSVSGGENIKVIAAAWHVYVTLDPPPPCRR